MKIQPTPILSNPQYNPERPIRPREPDPHSQRTERDSERGGGDLDELERELVVGVGLEID
jgi:hypothetical protein